MQRSISLTKDEEQEKEQEQELSSKQARFVDCLLAGSNLSTAAATCRISLTTATRWNRLDSVQASLSKAREQLFEDRLATLKDACGKAIDVLVKHMSDDDTPAYIAVQAASKVLEMALQLYRFDILEKKLQEIEAALKTQGRKV